MALVLSPAPSPHRLVSLRPRRMTSSSLRQRSERTARLWPLHSRTRNERRVRSCREDFSCSVATLVGQIEAAACPGASAAPRAGVLGWSLLFLSLVTNLDFSERPLSGFLAGRASR